MQHLAFERRGRGEPLLLLPGAGADPCLWDAVANRLAPSYELHLAEIAGFAGRPRGKGSLWPAVLDELVGYASTLDTTVVVGHSWGGFLGWSLLVAGMNVKAGVVVDSMPALGALLTKDRTALDRAVNERVARLRGVPPEALARHLEPSIVAMTRSSEQADRVLALAARSDPEALADAMQAAWLADLRPALASVDSAVTLVLPGDEHLAPEVRAAKHALARQQIEELPSHRVVAVPEAGHYVMLDQPEALASIIHDVAEAV